MGAATDEEAAVIAPAAGEEDVFAGDDVKWG